MLVQSENFVVVILSALSYPHGAWLGRFKGNFIDSSSTRENKPAGRMRDIIMFNSH